MTILFIFGFYEIKIVDTNFNITNSRLKNKIKNLKLTEDK